MGNGMEETLGLPELTWTCPYEGLETPDPEAHLRTAHNLSIEEVIGFLEEIEQARKNMSRLLMMNQEMGFVSICPMCGQDVKKEEGLHES